MAMLSEILTKAKCDFLKPIIHSLITYSNSLLCLKIYRHNRAKNRETAVHV